MSKELETSLSLSDCLCNICMEIFLEPVTLPCQHTLCNPCFQLTVEKASLCCPFCRRRVSSWARYNARKNTLINLKLWEAIQKYFPEECKRRINGQDQEEEDVCIPQPIRCLSKPGELRQEYEAEITKVEEERRANEQEESKASEEYIQKLLAEEEEQQRLAEEKKKQMAEQLLLDERLARELSVNLNSSSEGHILSSLSPGPSPLNSCKTSKSKSVCSGDIKKYLSPKSCTPSPSMVLFNKLEEESSGFSPEEISSAKNSFICGEEGREDEMPTLIPQISIKDRDNKDDFLEPLKPQLNMYTKDETTTLSLDLTYLSTYQGNELANELSHVACRDDTELVSPFSNREPAVSNFENNKFVRNMHLTKPAKDGTLQKTLISVISGNQQNSSSADCSLVMENSPVGNINPSGSLIEISLAKRKCQESSPEAAVNSHLKDKRRRTFCHTAEEEEEEMNEIQQQTSLEQKFYERFKQEQEDRLLALKLQKEMDKEEKTPNRKKGSPDEYHLRPKTSQSGSASPVSCKLLQNSQPPNKKTEADQRKHRRSSPNENSKLSNKRQPKSPGIKGGKVLNCVLNSSDSKEAELLPNKQKTILQMFKRSAAK
ncbi:PREDICTED: E3 ubiquitin-protein ligase RNF168 [Gekko japonicus]|uniref:RING-type E3 ubiquitin transferase n=1 Tax=Gekko japonicus TaxID=146911 RepID=A0ABM1KCZ4_GEKJA|nr:PREDICTED: E3 ubiquitin-protein ligase RNF168 [Gekko japonicus]XP_015271579.1 PREDICTED: E3 ubiquitin-protein ligase RNF168 [Gekko japonicus]XP_015271580.1 PREDICTED: E3 ubiquitin-protein ligase RNF168 [Gekko japonicus]XP_015271581.1 PREDICTED: E3 ubiquitin-protein ligase RNF168 [Gekko japonicus]XP_015271582.1 PREDICTED: E3 ubiquitin-protein ligase RNF168 [Gekko japonicus]XP_015271583.1 PREDICTED: E3 ubiquitin-protein ligase RNF168 [Gekko japonicus]